MKKLLIGLFAAAFIFAGCENSPNANGGTGTEETVSEEKKDNGDKKTPESKYIGTKAPEVAKEVGDIVFTDGSATPYTEELTLTDEQKAAAIAVIFYKGTGLNSDVYKGTEIVGKAIWETGDTKTVRTLGVGLKHNKSGLAWCSRSSNAYLKNISTIQCLSHGNYGEFTFSGDKNGSDNLEQIESFDEVDDTELPENYPAFYFAKNYKDIATNLAGTEYENGWYLPTLAEIFQIFVCMHDTTNGLNVDSISELCGGDIFNDNNKSYCTSSQFFISEYRNYTFNFYDGGWEATRKIDAGSSNTRPFKVCAIREFN